MDRRKVIWLGIVIALATAGALTFRGALMDGLRSLMQTTDEGEADVIFVTTPPAVVKAMLEVARVGPGDLVLDLGSGDGRIPIAAARDFGARGVGVEIDSALIDEARENARRAGVSDRVAFLQEDLFEADLREATVVTLYLLPPLNLKLRPRLLNELKPGSRVVSHAFDMGDWPPDQELSVEGRKVYLWVVPADAKGSY